MDASQIPPRTASTIQRVVVWSLFLLAAYLLRDQFFILFMTFLFCYLIRRVVNVFRRGPSPHAERPGLERLLVLGCAALMLASVCGLLVLLGPRIVVQAHDMAGRLGAFQGQQLVFSVLERTVGVYLFRSRFGDPADPRYQDALVAFETDEVRVQEAGQAFAQLESSLVGGFEHKFHTDITHRARVDTAREDPNSEQFDAWFLSVQTPQLLTTSDLAADPASAQSLLDRAKRDPARFATLHEEWIQDLTRDALQEQRDTAQYRAAFESYYRERQAANPATTPYPFETFEALREAHAESPESLARALAEVPGNEAQQRASLQAAFERSQRAELALDWWQTSHAAQFLREHAGPRLVQSGAALLYRLEELLGRFLRIPMELLMALLLSVFIMIDFRTLERGMRRLATSSFAVAYDEIAPHLVRFADLLGTFFASQAIIALCNSLLTLLSLNLLGVEHAYVLTAVVFVCSFIPVLGVLLSGIPIVLVAVTQPGGSLALGLGVIAMIALIHLLETSILNPYIVGKKMHVHPVLVIAVLIPAENYFGIWGLLLGIPVAAHILGTVLPSEQESAQAQ